MTLPQAAAALALCLLVCVTRPASLDAQRQTTATAEALDHWVVAVNAHMPGRADAAVQSVVAMTWAARVDLNTSLPLFIEILRGDTLNPRSELEKKIAGAARTARLTPGTRAFVERAAILHADAVFLNGRLPSPPGDAPPIPKPRPVVPGDLTAIGPDAPPPLLTNEGAVLTRDGQVIGETRLTWHLPFARSLLSTLLKQDRTAPGPSPCANRDCRAVEGALEPITRDDRELVSAWYHAVSAYLFANGMNGDATSHLADAARVLPDDPLALFDRATYAETLGLPIYQAVRGSAAPSRPGALLAGIPDEEKTNTEAERLYRRALDADPSLVEARVRLARLLQHRGRTDEAATEIETALGVHPSGVPGYYARIVAGRIAAARGRYDESVHHYRAASELFAHAQSALLGESQAALMAADVTHARSPIAQLSGRNTDPWLDYQLGAGRDAPALMAAQRARLAAPAADDHGDLP
jgi:tetratricopeptide (TPR) repeat protein